MTDLETHTICMFECRVELNSFLKTGEKDGFPSTSNDLQLYDFLCVFVPGCSPSLCVTFVLLCVFSAEWREEVKQRTLSQSI